MEVFLHLKVLDSEVKSLYANITGRWHNRVVAFTLCVNKNGTKMTGWIILLGGLYGENVELITFWYLYHRNWRNDVLVTRRIYLFIQLWLSQTLCSKYNKTHNKTND